jgi:arabinan endo-1,5-alpha-L-arabinosidase
MTTYTNPVLDTDFPDPMVLRASDGRYYGYATQAIQGGRTINVQVARSDDLVRWAHCGEALPVKPPWARGTQRFWAPHVIEAEGRFFIYYSGAPDAGGGLCLAVAVADHPLGPFTDRGTPLACGPSFSNIDPMAFDDPATGRRWLYWGSACDPIRAQELAPDRLGFLPGTTPAPVLLPGGASPYERLLEGAFLVARDGAYYLFYSGDNCCDPDPHYAVMVARAPAALGPFERFAGPDGDPVILAGGPRWEAPGHNSVVRDAAGEDWIVYHAIDRRDPLLPPAQTIRGDRRSRRVMLMDRLDYTDGWPRVAGGAPSTTPQRAPVAR